MITCKKAAAIAVALVAMVGSTAAAVHITPTVVLRKQADVIRSTLPGAHQYFVRTVKIGRTDMRRIRTEASFKPDDRKVKFFLAKDADDQLLGIVLFPQSNTQHGPLEVGLTLGPDGVLTSVVATKATAETKPWVLKAARSGLMKGFVGMRYGDRPEEALAKLDPAELGKMPYFFAGVTAEAVRRGLALYEILYEEAETSTSS